MLKILNYFFIIILLFFNVLSAKELKKVTLQLSWFDQFQFAGYYMAKEKGFYKDLGLDVEIKAFKFGIDIPKEVNDSKIDFAVGRETLILEKIKNPNIKALYATFQATPLILMSTKESGINNINDFKNKRIMTTIDDASEVSLKAMIKSNNVSISELNFLKHTHNINDLINKKTDVISAYISKSPYDLNKKNLEYNVFDPKKYGFDLYSDFLYTNNKLIASDLSLVKAFKKASIKGWQYAYENIEESSKLILDKYNSQSLSLEALIFEGKELKKLSYFKTSNFGEIKKEKVQRIYDLYNVMGLVENRNINISSFYDSLKKSKNVNLSYEERIYLQNLKSIKMCVVPNSMPYSAIKDSKYVGFVSDYIKLIEKKLNLDIVLLESKTWFESLDNIRNKKCEILPLAAINEERKNYLHFTSSYSSLPYVLVTKGDIPFISNIKKLKNKKIGIVKGHSIYKEFKALYPNLDFVLVDTNKEGLEKVLNDELFAQLDLMYTFLYKLEHENIGKLKISAKFEKADELRVAIRKDLPLLASSISKTVDSISDDEAERLLNRWINIEYKNKYDYKFLLQISFIVFLVFAVLLYRQYLLKKMNKSLNKIVEEKTQELKKINNHLEERIQKEVEENIKKDSLLSRQAKMASMGEMIENIAHQWRQPLSLITTAASGVKVKRQWGELDDKTLDETIDRIIDTSQYLSTTIDDFRYFFKPNKEKELFKLDETIDKTLNILKSKFESENIVVVQNTYTKEILGFENELIQILMNIFNNAKDALVANDKNERFIFIDFYERNGKTIIKIKDNAGGIPPEIIEKIFEPYFTTKHKSQGTGIGLYMCEQIINKYMNGSIEVSNHFYNYNNKQYKGAVFAIVFNN